MYIVIDFHGGADYCFICADTEGNNMVFATEPAASEWARENCQCGRPVEIPFPWNCVTAEDRGL